MDTIGNVTVRDVLEYQALCQPDTECIVHEDPDGQITVVTYAELDALTNIVAHGLKAAGLSYGDRVLMFMMNSIPLVTTIYACAKAGLIGVPVNTGYVGPELAHTVDLVEPRAVVVDAEYLPAIAPYLEPRRDLQIVCMVGDRTDLAVATVRPIAWREFCSCGSADAITDPLRSDDVLQLIMTSGTTARPKAVMRTHANCLWSAYRFAMYARITQMDRSLTALPAFHVNCLDQTLVSSLVSGATVVLLQRYSATRFWDQVRRHKATIISLVPTIIRTLLAQPPTDSDRSHHVRLAMAGLQLHEQEIKDFRQRFGLTLLNGYGLTEASTNVTLLPPGGDPKWPSIGLPALDRTIRLVDDAGMPVRDGEVGEIVVQGVPGRSLMLGYYRDEEATAAALRDEWLYTGDLARCDEHGYFYFVDRKKDMIKVAGENVAALEVEMAISQHPAVREVAVIGVPDALRDEAVKAVVVLHDHATLELEDLQEHCRGLLAKFKIPTVLEIVEDLPRSTIGKVDKGMLRRGEGQGAIHHG